MAVARAARIGREGWLPVPPSCWSPQAMMRAPAIAATMSSCCRSARSARGARVHRRRRERLRIRRRLEIVDDGVLGGSTSVLDDFVTSRRTARRSACRWPTRSPYRSRASAMVQRRRPHGRHVRTPAAQEPSSDADAADRPAELRQTAGCSSHGRLRRCADRVAAPADGGDLRD